LLTATSFGPAIRPDELRQGCEDDLRSLRREQIDVVHLCTMASAGVPFLESLDAWAARTVALSPEELAQIATTPAV
jgi:methyl coenzyme M reductase subunit C